MLGVPEADRHHLRPWSADICKMYELNPSTEMQHDAVRASNEFSAYLRELARERKRDPGEDLISQLALVVDEGERLTEDELVGTCVLLLNAGHEATVNSTLLGWWTLFRNPDRLRELRADRSLLPNAIEELLRFDTPLQMFERWVLEPFEIHGVQIPRGAELGLLFGSANRDPSVFDRPDELDLTREPNPHLTFGAGIHFCLGRPARPSGAPGLVRDADRPVPEPRARRGAALEAELRDPRPRGAARPSLKRPGAILDPCRCTC